MKLSERADTHSRNGIAVGWDVFVQDLPPGIDSIADIPDDFRPASLGPREAIVAGILTVVPDADFADPTWGRIEGPDYSIEVNVGPEDPVQGFAFHIGGGAMAAGIVADILETLDLRALDPQSDTSLFDAAQAVDSLRRWRLYRDQVVGHNE